MDFTLIGVNYDKTQTFIKGAAKAPDLIRKIFPKLETFINGVDLAEEAFFEDLGDITPTDLSDMNNRLFVELSKTKKFPIIIGGEHTVTFSCVKALRPDYVVIFDAHPDCEDTDGHTGIARRMSNIIGKGKVLLYGVRIASKKEDEFLKTGEVKIVDIKDLKKLKGRVYLSIDYDVLDPSILPSVGNPEPDGLKFSEVMEAVRILAPNLIAVDFVEYTPFTCTSRDVYTSIAGKMIYETIAEIIKAKK